MATWKKVIVSGSNAELGNLYVSGNITGSNISSSGELYFSASNNPLEYIVTIDPATGKLYKMSTSSLAVELNLQVPLDGTYDDGLLPFTSSEDSSTTISDAIDDINEVLAGLAPPPAPNLDDLEFTDNITNVAGNLSYGTTNGITGHTNVTSTALSNPDSALSSIDVNGLYSITTTGNDQRIGIVDARTSNQNIGGVLNGDVVANPSGAPGNGQFINYGDNSFRNGDKGYLRLWVNGSNVHDTVLSGSNGGVIASSINLNGSGFVNLSATQSAHFPATGNPLTIFKHRSGSFIIGANDQGDGWNYARVEHIIDGTATKTNYIEWVNEVQSSTLSATSEDLPFTGLGAKWLSGVKYFTGFSSSYQASVSNVYRNVYSDDSDAIDFGNTNTTLTRFNRVRREGLGVTNGNSSTTSTAPNYSLPLLDTSDPDCHTRDLLITASLVNKNDVACVTTSTAFSIDLDSIKHPIKTNLSNAASETLTGMLLDNRDDNSTPLSETFVSESYRLKDDGVWDDDTQTGASNAIGGFDSTANLTTGFLVYPGATNGNDDNNTGNGSLLSPLISINGGNFSSLSNAPTGNPDYSSTSGGKQYFRIFRNNIGSTANMAITINGSGTITTYGNYGANNNFSVRIKYPGYTAWLDLAASPTPGQNFLTDNQGCLVGTLDSSLNATNTFTTVGAGGGSNVAPSNYIVVEIASTAVWTGYINAISINFSA